MWKNISEREKKYANLNDGYCFVAKHLRVSIYFHLIFLISHAVLHSCQECGLIYSDLVAEEARRTTSKFTFAQ